MSRHMTGNMLRTRRRDNNVKPNRRLDRKSSRGMIYENEELRLKTININAEIERGQYDIKKLKRENELLKKEIWCLRDEYDKLDKLLKEKEMEFSSSSTTCTSDSESCSSCSSEESDEVETSQNLQNVQKTNMKNLHVEFDHLSVVPEENSTGGENSDNNRTSLPPNDQWAATDHNDDDIIKPDQSYPLLATFKANTLPPALNGNVATPIFAPIKISKSFDDTDHYTTEKLVNTNASSFYQNVVLVPPKPEPKLTEPTLEKSGTDLIVKTDNHGFHNSNNGNNNETATPTRSTFSNGGNLEDLLNDIETISKDILKITTDQNGQQQERPYKSELNVVLMPNPMPLLGFDRYSLPSKSLERLSAAPQDQQETTGPSPIPVQHDPNPFFLSAEAFTGRYNPDNFDSSSLTPSNEPPRPGGSKTNLLDLTSSELISSENEENLKFKTTNPPPPTPEANKSPKLSIRRKVSIHFKGKKDKDKKHGLFDIRFGQHKKTPSLESKKSTTDIEPKTPTSSDSKTGSEKKQQQQLQQQPVQPQQPADKKAQPSRKSPSASPDRKQRSSHEKKHKKHKKGGDRGKSRRGTITSIDRLHRERSYSACTDRSTNFDHRFYDSERERTNSLSSCDSFKTRRKMSNLSIPMNGKVPWCACWGNGCI